MKNSKKVILASASPRRKELLNQIGVDFDIVVSKVEEHVTTHIPMQVVEELSSQKARAVYESLTEEMKATSLVLGADTIVACAGQIMGKPKSEEDAVNMLMTLQGKAHQVYTGVTFVYEEDKQIKTYSFHEATDVIFYEMSPEEIKEYVATKDPMDKAGAYGIQGFCARHIKGISGDYNNVVGLPVGRVYQELRKLGML